MTNDLGAGLSRLPLITDLNFSARDVPRNGIYFFYERSEGERIVRVGTHRGNGRLYDRLRDHYGTRRSFRAWRRTSVFRYHLGAALLNRDQDPDLASWLDRKGERMRDAEAQVTELLNSAFTFRALRVDDLEERLDLERALIGALSAMPRMSEQWLGRYAIDSNVRRSGLWNSDHIGAATPLDMGRLGELIDHTLTLQNPLERSTQGNEPEAEQDNAR